MTIARFKDREEWTVAEILEHGRTGKQPESDDYRTARREALEDAGLESDDPADKALEEMSAGEHLTRIRRNR